ncbi:11657_t:CDS:2, partial [Racocetra fulgida]
DRNSETILKLSGLTYILDAIFEPNIVEIVSTLVSESVENIGQIFGSLCHSYTGEPSKIQLLSDLYDEFVSSDTQPKADLVNQDALMNILLDKYEIVKIDEVKIADANHIDEIKHLKSASTNIDVYSKVLLDQFDNLITQDEAGVSQSIPDLIKTAVQHPHSYLFAQALIKRLSEEQNGYPLRKLAKELEKAAPPLQIATSILRIPPTPGDIVAVNKTINMKPDIKEKYLYLAAYAASAEERNDGQIDNSRVNTTFETLKRLSATLSKKGVIGLEFNAIVQDLLVYIE